MIPRLIHQTAKNTNISEEWTCYQTKVKALHPDWTYHLWTDEDNLDLVATRFPQYHETYVGLPRNIMRADTIRYMLMYAFGGMYLDLDYEMLKSFTPLSGRVVLPRESENKDRIRLGNSIFASEPGHPFWEAVLEELKATAPGPNVFVEEDDILHITGPMLLTRVYHKHFANDPEIHIPSLEEFNPEIPGDDTAYKKLTSTGVAFGIHHCTGSWRALTLPQRIWNKLVRFLKLAQK